MAEKKSFEFSRKNPMHEKYPDKAPLERLRQGFVVVGPTSLSVEPEDDYYGGDIAPDEAVKLARAILEEYRTPQRVPMRMILSCVECGKTCEAPWDPDAPTSFTKRLYRETRWFVSVVSAPGSGEVVLAPLDPICAARVLPAELIAEFKRQNGDGGSAPPPYVKTSKLDDRYGDKKKEN
jgi:hypothetical protein